MASSNLSVLLMLLAVAVVTVLAQRRRPATTSTTTDEWNYRDGSERVNMRGVSNLTQVLDNWRFDILNQMRGLLQNDHQSLLPDYARIQPLSEALDDLYKEFNALKSHLGDLTEKFAVIETFIDEVKAGRAANGGPAAAGPGPAPAPVPRQTGRRVMKKKATSSSSSTSTSN
uniref:Si:ch211-76l23.4 n=1 Tax=Amphiprion percula TaxID=161767 RepID=A0A3P8S6Y1_AMPPE